MVLSRRSREVFTSRGYSIHVVGAPRAPFSDAYHSLLREPWPVTLAAVAAVYLAANALFALAYLLVGGVEGVRPGSFSDAFFFSVETMGTIGYGAMNPRGAAANALMVAESLVSLLVTAGSTGLVFAKLSRSTARLNFSREATVSPMNGAPTLAFRLGNERSNLIVDVSVRVSLTRTERTAEGSTFYRMYDLALARDRAPSLARSFTIFHVIDAASPLYGSTPASLAAEEAELQVAVLGLDDVTMQPVHALHRYDASEILYGARHVDILDDRGEALILDMTRFHHTEPTAPAEGFPYPATDEGQGKGAPQGRPIREPTP